MKKRASWFKMVLNGSAIDDSINSVGTYCYYLRAWAVSDSVSGGYLNIESGYGEIIVIVRDK
jgi:hypothetical protein